MSLFLFFFLGGGGGGGGFKDQIGVKVAYHDLSQTPQKVGALCIGLDIFWF